MGSRGWQPAQFPQGSGRLGLQQAPKSKFIELSFCILVWKRADMVSVAGEFETCTILFSDVVTFTNICAACEPIQIVNMLNSMYSKFDRLTNIHDVYKVSVCV